MLLSLHPTSQTRASGAEVVTSSTSHMGWTGWEWTQGWGKAAATSRFLKESAIAGLAEHRSMREGQEIFIAATPAKE